MDHRNRHRLLHLQIAAGVSLQRNYLQFPRSEVWRLSRIDGQPEIALQNMARPAFVLLVAPPNSHLIFICQCSEILALQLLQLRNCLFAFHRRIQRIASGAFGFGANRSWDSWLSALTLATDNAI